MGIVEKAKGWKSDFDKKRAEEKAVWDSAYADTKADIEAEHRQQKLQSTYEKAQKRAEMRYRFKEKAVGAVKGGLGSIGSSLKNKMAEARARSAANRAQRPNKGAITPMGMTNPNFDYGFGSLGKGAFGSGFSSPNIMGGGRRNRGPSLGLGASSLSLGSGRRRKIRVL